MKNAEKKPYCQKNTTLEGTKKYFTCGFEWLSIVERNVQNKKLITKRILLRSGSKQPRMKIILKKTITTKSTPKKYLGKNNQKIKNF